MAGGNLSKSSSKAKTLAKSGFSSEVLKDSSESQSASNQKVFSLRGILGLGQTVEVNRNQNKSPNWGSEFFGNGNHLQKEQQVLLDSRQQELQKTIQNLREEIKKLAKSTDKLGKDIEKAVLEPSTNISEYEISFLDRIKNFIANFRKNISEASCWMEGFSAKKKKRNCFWNQVKNKKGGGEQYLFSNEHSAARSAT